MEPDPALPSPSESRSPVRDRTPGGDRGPARCRRPIRDRRPARDRRPGPGSADLPGARPGIGSRRSRRRLAVVGAVLLAIVPGGAAPPAGAQEVFRVERLSPGVWAALVLPRPDAYAFANSLVVEGEEGVLVVDTQQSPTAARALIREIRRRTDRPVRWVVNTHGHGDHVWGNVAYREAFPDAVFVGHAGLGHELATEGAERLREERARVADAVEARARALAEAREGGGSRGSVETVERLRWSLRVNRAYAEDLEGLPLIPPDVEVVDALILDLGGREARVLALAPAHTRTDVVVWLPGDGILAAGDLVEEGVPWFGDAHPAGWAAALDSLASLGPRIVLPAHGGAQRDGLLLETERRFLRSLVDEVRRAASRGVDLDGARERVRLPEFRDFFADGDSARAEAYRKGVESAVERAWAELPEPSAGATGSP